MGQTCRDLLLRLFTLGPSQQKEKLMKRIALNLGLLLSLFTGFFASADMTTPDVTTVNCDLEQISPAGQWETGA